MSNKSGTSSQVISLPKGGGALQGIGEKFAPDLFTGTGNFTVPVALPPGRNGFQPDLSLVYSTGSGSEAFGLGWSLSIPGVSRQTSKGVPVYDNAKDTFVLSGAEDLVPVEGSETETRYRPRTEGLFARIVHHHDAANDYWEVRSKDGLVSHYGTPGAAGDDPAVMTDPTNRKKVFAWKLTQTRDPFGNVIKYEYRRDSGEEGPHHWDQLYLSRISYVDYRDGADEKFLVAVVFEYEDRPDPFSQYRAAFEIRTRKRCTRIEIRTHADADRLVRTYDLVYLDQRADPDDRERRLPVNGVSLLSRIVVTGHDAGATEELPPLEFGYTQFEPEGRDFLPLTGRDVPARSLASPELEMADLFGNGLPDIVEMNGTVRYWRNLGQGRFDLPRPMRDAPAGVTLAESGVQLVDADGDGRIDLMVTSASGPSGYFPLQFNGEWDRRSFRSYHRAPSFNLEDPEVRLVDLNGDGVTDAIRSGTRLECFFNDPKEGWNGTRFVERRAIADFPNINFSDPRVKWADMSGDGLQDIVLVYDGNVEYWPNLGYGNWGKRVSMRRSPRFPYGYDPQRILVGDVDGDGLADLVYVDHCKVLLWINQGGNRWSDPIEINGTPDTTDMDAVRLADMLGSGVSGVLWSRDAAAPGRETMFFLDFTGGLKPYLLNAMDNHMGAVTRVAYAPSTRFYLEDQTRPETRWKTPLPIPVQVGARVEVIDEISGGKLTTEYSYHHGYWDGAEREFRGFGMVEQRDTETFEDYNTAGLHRAVTDFLPVRERRHFSPPLLTKTWFHQGPVGDEHGEWVESDYRHEFWSGDPPLLSRSGTMTAFFNALPRRVKRDALRALRGRILRTESYALDDTERAQRPYTVTEHLHGVCGVLDEGEAARLACEADALPSDWAADDSATRIFFPHALAQRTTQWERGDDPTTQLTFTDDYDAFGQLRQQTSVALPRRSRKRTAVEGAVVGAIAEDEVNETRVLAVHTRTGYAAPGPGVYIHDRVSQARTFELESPPELAESDPDDLARLLLDQATAAATMHRRFRALLDPWRAGTSLPVEVRLIGHALNHYDGAAFAGRPVGEVGPYGALTRSEALVFTDHELDDAYGERRPAYLGGSAGLPAGAPVGFGSDLGYRRESASPDGYHDGYYTDTRRQQFDFQDPTRSQQRGVVVAVEDALGHRTTIAELDNYWLLPERVKDPVGLPMIAAYDYRVMQPRQVTSPNGNRTHYTFTPLGLVEAVAVMGKEGEERGDTPDHPGTVFLYDFLAFENSPPDDRQPVFVHAIQRVQHRWESIHAENQRRREEGRPRLTEVEIGEMFPASLADELRRFPERFVQSREYSDGFGRLIQTRAQAEELIFGESGDDVGLPREAGSAPGPAVGRRVSDRVVVSGWQVYDNKGQVIEKYEPFFGQGWAFQREADAKKGEHGTLYYDPHGQVIRTVNPDGSEQRVIFGIPADLGDPETFSPTPWESYTYDPNDLAPLSRGRDGAPLTERAPADHHYTPASAIMDGLGRVICQVERNGDVADQDWHVTRSSYDMRGNLLEVTDALGRPAFEYRYDLLNNSLQTRNIDAGLRTSVLDAAGNLVEYRDSKGSVTLRQYDDLNRLTHLWARNDVASSLTLRERLVYGDGSDRDQPESERAANRSANRLGELSLHYDEAGLQRLERYDFKGNIEETARRVVSDTAIAGGWIAAWAATGAESALEGTEYVTSTQYDALNRPVNVTYPEDVNGQRAVLTPRYNRAGALEAVELDGEPYVTQIAYNAKGQRLLVAYGNRVMTRYAYDPRTFRLARLRSERCADAAPPDDTWRGTGGAEGLFQDFAYTYDLAGNILSIEDDSPNSGIAGSPDGRNRLVRRFGYDPIYRLTEGSGRACRDIGLPRPLADLARCGAYTAPYTGGPPTPNQNNAPDLTERYTETYSYDPMGNMLELGYRAASGRWTRRFGLASALNNRLAYLEQGGATHRFEYDANGNMLGQNTERHYTWDHADRLIAFTTRPDGSSHASVEARYLYDAGGMRVKKWVRTSSTGAGQSTIYIDGMFEHYTDKDTGLANNHLHVMDDQQRIALVRRGPAHPDNAGPPMQYHLGDHLGSSSVVIGGDNASANAFVNSEEYFPYGETSFGSFGRKRYRYTGKERDEESGWSYHSARFYIPWLATWASVDPGYTRFHEWSPYNYANCNPLRFADLSGHDPDPVITEADVSQLESRSLAARDQASRARYALNETVEKIKNPNLNASPLPTGEELRGQLQRRVDEAARAANEVVQVRREVERALEHAETQLAEQPSQGPHRTPASSELAERLRTQRRLLTRHFDQLRGKIRSLRNVVRPARFTSADAARSRTRHQEAAGSSSGARSTSSVWGTLGNWLRNLGRGAGAVAEVQQARDVVSISQGGEGSIGFIQFGAGLPDPEQLQATPPGTRVTYSPSHPEEIFNRSDPPPAQGTVEEDENGTHYIRWDNGWIQYGGERAHNPRIQA